MRRNDREIIDINEIIKLLEKGKFLHLGMISGEYPHIIPMHYGYKFCNDRFLFYMHCANEGEKLNLIRLRPAVCVEIETGVTLVPGGDIPCKYGSTYASFIGRGTAAIVEDSSEKMEGLTSLMEHQTGQHFEITSDMAASVTVIKVEVDSFTAKTNKGQGADL